MTVVLVVICVALLVSLIAALSRVRDQHERLRSLTTRLDAANEQAHDRAGRVEARLTSAIDAVVQGIVIYDEHGAVAHSNEVAASFLAARHSEALVDEAIAEIAQRAIAGQSETRSVDLFGPPRRTLVLRASPLGPLGALVIIEDISERRRLENVRRDFVANISHELKTPVGALGLLAETLLGEDDPDLVQRLAERMHTEAHRVGRTIDDLLELSRIEAEESRPAEAEPVHLVIAEAVERVRPAAEQSGIDIEIDEPNHRLTVVGDRRQLVSAVYNLLENAVKYSDAGSLVEARASTNGRWVDIAIRDHGIGIPRRDLERVFERFYRVDRGRSRETGGTGLGLAIVRHVASNHRGEVRVESREGEGSTFTLRLPAGPGPVAITLEAG